LEFGSSRPGNTLSQTRKTIVTKTVRMVGNQRPIIDGLKDQLKIMQRHEITNIPMKGINWFFNFQIKQT